MLFLVLNICVSSLSASRSFLKLFAIFAVRLDRHEVDDIALELNEVAQFGSALRGMFVRLSVSCRLRERRATSVKLQEWPKIGASKRCNGNEAVVVAKSW